MYIFKKGFKNINATQNTFKHLNITIRSLSSILFCRMFLCIILKYVAKNIKNNDNKILDMIEDYLYTTETHKLNFQRS